MTKYDIHIKGYEDGLSKNAVEKMFEDLHPFAESVEVVEASGDD